MSLRRFIERVVFGGPPLRNKPGGLAMIRGLTNPDSQILNGRIVTTVRADGQGFWVIDPPQAFVAQIRWVSVRDEPVQPGDHVQMVQLADEHLLPLKKPGNDARTQERNFQPQVPVVMPTKETS